MRKILVLGGTRFFGKRLVYKLLENGDDVTVATRGETKDEFGDRVKRVKVDRFDREAMETVFSKNDVEWDVIYDQICFAPDDAKDACEVFKDRVKKYVLTSTLSVYPIKIGEDLITKEEMVEKDFDPFTYPITYGRRAEFDYGEGKRLAEAVFFQTARFPVVAPRPPIVLGLDDYTERLHYHVRKVLQGETIGIDNVEKKISFVDSEDLAQFLFWVGCNDLVGPVNTSAPDHVTLGEMIGLIENVANKRAKVLVPKSREEYSPMNFPISIYQDVSMAKAAGYSFKPLSAWFEPLIQEIVKLEK